MITFVDIVALLAITATASPINYLFSNNVTLQLLELSPMNFPTYINYRASYPFKTSLLRALLTSVTKAT